jgi:hypothetical protein
MQANHLSEWDVLALDESGRPCNGISSNSPAGVVVEIQRDLLHVLHKEIWNTNCLVQYPTVGMVEEGAVWFLDTYILATSLQHKQGVIWATWFQQQQELFGIVGVSCHGLHAGKYLGVTPDDVVCLQKQLQDWNRQGKVPEKLGSLGFENALRFNQGDAFFASKMGHALSSTRVGEASLPLFFHSSGIQTAGPPQETEPSNIPDETDKTVATARPVRDTNDTKEIPTQPLKRKRGRPRKNKPS